MSLGVSEALIQVATQEAAGFMDTPKSQPYTEQYPSERNLETSRVTLTHWANKSKTHI